MRTGITTKLHLGRSLVIAALLMLSLMAVNSSEASSSLVININRPEALNSIVININQTEASNPARTHAETERLSVNRPTDTLMNPTTNTCLMAEQLKDPEIRADYDAIIADTEGIGINRYVHLDPISMECISCHDGTLAKMAIYRVSEGNSHRVRSSETLNGAHPVGMDYNNSRRDKTYVPAENLGAAIILINGKVGCVSCHNLLDRNDKYLSVDNSKSSLCYSCHNI